jgi:hypothetical protein
MSNVQNSRNMKSISEEYTLPVYAHSRGRIFCIYVGETTGFKVVKKPVVGASF